MDVRQDTECPVCQKAQTDFNFINGRINNARTAVAKVSYTRELLQKVEAVLKEHQNVDSALAEACRSVLNLRKQTAELILKFEK
jgi:hypothetical protein